jgi:hypothetical protein
MPRAQDAVQDVRISRKRRMRVRDAQERHARSDGSTTHKLSYYLDQPRGSANQPTPTPVLYNTRLITR